MKYAPEDGTWIVDKRATGLFEVQEKMSVEDYQATKDALQLVLCDYFSSGNCDFRGTSISPIGTTPNGGKRFKVACAGSSHWDRAKHDSPSQRGGIVSSP